MVICLERDADLHLAQLMPLPGSPGQRAVKRVCVCVCVCVCVVNRGTVGVNSLPKTVT